MTAVLSSVQAEPVECEVMGLPVMHSPSFIWFWLLAQKKKNAENLIFLSSGQAKTFLAVITPSTSQ